jgi:hypothetical protein
MTSISFLVIIASFVALLVVGAEDMGSGHMVFANRAFSGHETFTNKGINVQTDTNQDQGCEAAGGTSAINNACTATSGPGSTETSTSTSTQTSVSLFFASCGVAVLSPPSGFQCSSGGVPVSCSNIGCTSILCDADLFEVATANCITNNGVQLTSCTGVNSLTCTRTETHTVTHTVPGTGITQSGGVSG